MARHLITSALPYINGVKHLGNLVGSMLPADVYARYLRRPGHEVLAICATDEHGTPAELAAAEAGMDVAEYCTEQHEVQTCARASGSGCRGTGSDAPHARRTTCSPTTSPADSAPRATPRSGRRQQVYSVDDGRFLPDRYVDRHVPQLRVPAGPWRPVRELRQAARPDRPDRPSLGHLGFDRPRGPRVEPRVPPAVQAGRPDPGLGRHQGRTGRT